jgi:dynein heavy chain
VGSIEKVYGSIQTKFGFIESEIEEIGNLLFVQSRDVSSSKKKKALTLRELFEQEPKLVELKDHYAEKLYDAVNTSIHNSLSVLAESCGYQTERRDAHDKDLLTSDEYYYNNSLNSNSNEMNALKYLRIKSADQKDLRPPSVKTALVNSTWNGERSLNQAFLNIEFTLKYTIPDVITEPSLDFSQKIVKSIAQSIIETSKAISWYYPDENKPFFEKVIEDPEIHKALSVFDSLISEIGPSIKSHMIHFKLFEFLWKEDLNTLFDEFMKHDPGEFAIKREVERLAQIEKQVFDIPEYLSVGPICLSTESVKRSLKTFAYSWKCKYCSVLHEIARNRLESSIVYRENVQKRLSVNVQTLEQLNDALRLLEELSDMENKVDQIYLPIENIYADLRRYELILTRQEIDQVTNLRENWFKLMNSAEVVRTTLLQDKRNTLEQELDKQVKTFVVEVIRFRNSFDATGPSVTGIDPYEALRRLAEFQKQYDTFDARRKTLDSISILFGLQCKPFPELDKTGEELNLLNQLYKVYQVFLDFDRVFRNTLWSDVDLAKASNSIRAYWEDFLALPDKLKENWDAYFDLKKALKKYIDVLPILLLLNEKEIRNRHWLQVMQVTKSAFRLEAAVFKLNDLIDIGLDLHASEIEEICKAAKKEQELESRMRTIEEEWNEQVLSFSNYKDYGEVCFDKEYTERLLEQLEDAQEVLASMLTSKFVTPLRNEVASWSEKLKTIGDVLELWLEVQELWINIESVFSNPLTVKEMPAESKRFSRVDKSWIRSQKQSFDMKSVLQCCLGSSVQENTKRVLLKDIQKELEICFKSLNGYLEKKRRSFPRYYFLSNSALLTLLSHSNGHFAKVKPFLSSLFSAVADLKVDEMREDEKISSISTTSFSFDKPRSVMQSSHDTPTFFRKPESTSNAGPELEIVEVYSADGEVLPLFRKVGLDKGAENWLPKLKESISDSLRRYLSHSLNDIINNISTEELALKYPAQICLVALSFMWTKEAEASIIEFKNERKTVNVGGKKFSQISAKLFTLLSKTKWTGADKPILQHQKLRLEAMMTVSFEIFFLWSK